jgi:RNA polymerase sigma factor (sigma-70 family)
MSTTIPSAVLRVLRHAIHDCRMGECSDRDLLEHFLHHQDEAAFEEILSRHGPMVLDVCRSLVPNQADAEDVFQATFLVLVRRAGSLRATGSLGGFLHGVACRTAMQARARFAVRRKHESRAPASPVAAPEATAWNEISQLLHEELARLSERHRLPLVLCYLQGHTQDQAADLLGLSKGTLKRRLEVGRARLRQRLLRRGVGPAAVLLAASWPAAVSAVPAAVARMTLHAAMSFATHEQAANLSAGVFALVQASTRLPVLTPVKLLLAATLLLSLAAAGLSFARKGAAPRAEAPSALALAEDKPPSREDRYGDPLPERVVARLGTQRFRSDGWVGHVVVAPGGKQLLGMGQQAVILWDAATGKEVRRFQGPAWRQANNAGYGVRIESFTLSPDGKTLAAGTTDGSKLPCPILLFDLASGKKIGECAGHKGKGWSSNHTLAFVTPTLLASAGADDIALLHDVTRREEVRNSPFKLETTGLRSIRTLIPESNGKYLFGTGSAGESLCWVRWEVATGKIVQREKDLRGNFITAALSPDGRSLAVSLGVGEVEKEGGYNEVRIYAAPKWHKVRQWKTHTGRFPQRNSIAFATDGKSIATGGADQRARRWDLEGKEIGEPITPYRYANNVGFFDPDTLMTFGSQQTVRFWNTKTGKPQRAFLGAESHLTAVAYSPDGRYVVAGGGGGDSTARVWEIGTGKQVAHLRSEMADVTCLQFSPDGKQIASADSFGVARLWDWSAGRQIHALRDRATSGWLKCVAYSPSGKQLAAGDEAGVIRVWNTADGKLTHTLPAQQAVGVAALVFSPDGRKLFSGRWDHTIRCWDLTMGKEVLLLKGDPNQTRRGTPIGHTNVVTSLALSPGGCWLYSGSYDHMICVWESRTGKLCRVLKHQEKGFSSVNAVALSGDGTLLAAALGDEGKESLVHLWDVLTGKKIAALAGHRGKVTSLAFAPNGRRLASASTDTTILVWDVAGLTADRATQNEKALAPLWDDLAADAPRAYAAVCQGAAAGNDAVTVLERKLKPIAGVDREKFNDWVRQLDSEQFADRERASQALANLGLAAEPLLRQTASRATSVEVRARVNRLLSRLETDGRRSLYALEILETIGSPQARRLLAQLAKGSADAPLTRKAAAALKRLERRR